MRVVILMVLTLALAGCGQRQDMPVNESSDALVSLDAPMVAARAGAPPGPPPGEKAPQDTPAGAPATAPMIAYAYTDSIWAPAARVKPLMQLHQKACVDAGPVACQVVSIQQSQGDQARALLEVRATPAWIAQLHQRLEGDAKAAGGHVTESEVSSEDLTRSIVDGEAHLRAQTTLRDRLQALLAERPGKLSELLDVERELARVQGEVDAAQSNLAVMRTRVATSSLTLSYQSLQPSSRPSGAWGPLVEAMREIQSTLATSLGFLVRLAAFALPWIVVLGLAVWLLRKRLPRLRRKTGAPETPPPV